MKIAHLLKKLHLKKIRKLNKGKGKAIPGGTESENNSPVSKIKVKQKLCLVIWSPIIRINL